MTVNTLFDLRRLLVDFMKDEGPVTVAAKMSMQDENGRVVNYKVTAPADTDWRKMIKQGFESLREKTNVSIEVDVGGRMWMDDLIERMMGGKRDGNRISWTLREGTFKFDPVDNKLVQING